MHEIQPGAHKGFPVFLSQFISFLFNSRKFYICPDSIPKFIIHQLIKIHRKQILILLLIVPFALFGQKFQKGTILFKNGKTLTCLLKPPSSPTDKKIETKLTEDADKISYKSEELKSVSILTGDSSVYEFEWQPSKKLLSDGLDYGWLYVILKGYATLYGNSDGYKIN